MRELEGGGLVVSEERRERESKKRKDDKLAGESDEVEMAGRLLAIRRDLFLLYFISTLFNSVSGMLLPLHLYFSFFSFQI